MRHARTNPGIVQRFAGGVLGKGHWVLPIDEHLERARRTMVARGLHPAGIPLEPAIEDALRAQHAEAVEVYGRGGPEAVDEWVKGVTGGKRRNPIDMITLLGLGVIAGAVQGVVEPYVTKHVYGVGSGTAAENPSNKYAFIAWHYPSHGITPGTPSFGRRMTVRQATEENLDLEQAGSPVRWVPLWPDKLPEWPYTTDTALGVVGNPRMFQGHKPFPVMVRVPGKGYLTEIEKTAAGIVDHYADHPGMALQLGYWELRDYQERHQGEPRADIQGVVEAFEEWQSRHERKGNPYIGETQILRIIPNVEDGTEIHVARIRQGYSVVLKDTDAGEFLSSQRIYKTEAAAMAAAEAVAAGKEPAMRRGNPTKKNPYGEPTFRKGRRMWGGQMGGAYSTKAEAVEAARQFATEIMAPDGQPRDEVMIWTTGGGKREMFKVEMTGDKRGSHAA